MPQGHVLSHALLGIGLASAAALGQQIEDIGVPPGAVSSVAFAISADGSAVTGYAILESTHLPIHRAIRWTRSGGIENLGTLQGSSATWGFAISNDGSVVVGDAFSSFSATAFQWRAATAMQPAYSGSARGVSADGLVIVGNAGVPVRWTEAGGVQALSVLPGGASGRAYGVSADGLTVAGYSESSAGIRAVRWTDTAFGPGIVQDLGLLPGAETSQSRAISATGRVIVGLTFAPGGNRAFRWTEARGMEDLGVLPGMINSGAIDVSADGSVVVGSSSEAPGGSSRPFIWTRQTGMLELGPYLESRGVDLTGWVLDVVMAISDDGSVLTGYGTHHGALRGWVVMLPLDTCLPNCDASTMEPVLNVDDFTCFINAFAQAQSLAHQQQIEHYANCDGSTVAPVLNVDDFTCFINAFVAGCP